MVSLVRLTAEPQRASARRSQLIRAETRIRCMSRSIRLESTIRTTVWIEQFGAGEQSNEHTTDHKRPAALEHVGKIMSSLHAITWTKLT